MNPALIESALPAALVSALTLIDAEADVYVSDDQRVIGQTSPQAFLLRLPPTETVGGLGETGWAYPYRLRLESEDGTRAQLQTAARELKRYFHGARRPLVAGLLRSEVRGVVMDLHPAEGLAVALEADLVFYGREAQAPVYDDGLGITWLAIWDATERASITDDSAGVSSWADLSGNGYDLSQSADAYKPNLIENAHNGLSAVRFVAANREYLASDPPVTAAPFTVFLVGTSSSQAADTVAWYLANDVSGNEYWNVEFLGATNDKVAIRCYAGAGASERTVTSTTYTADQLHLVTVVVAASDDRVVELDSAGTGTGTTDLTPTGIDAFYLCRYGVTYHGGDIAFCAIANGELTTAQIARVENKLAGKYGLTIT